MRDDQRVVWMDQISQEVSGGGVVDHGAGGNSHEGIRAAPAILAVAGAMAASFTAEFVSEVEIEEGRKLRISDEAYIAPVPSRTSGRTRITIAGFFVQG